MLTRERIAALSSFLLVSAAAAAGDRLNVVTTTTDLKALAEAVGGERVSVTSIATGAQDPHFVEAKPGFMLAARRADLFVQVGLELEIGWAPLVVEGSRNPRIKPGAAGFLDASGGVTRLEVPSGTVDRSQGDIHAFGNPHYWLDPWNARHVAGSIATKLGEISAGDETYFQARLAAFTRALDAAMFGAELVAVLGGDRLWDMARRGDLAAALAVENAARSAAGQHPPPPLGGWAAALAPYRGARVVTYHRSWSYLLSRFGLESTGQIEPKPGIPPTPSHLVGLIEKAKADRVGAILVEPWYSEQAAQLIASKTGARILRLPLSVGGAPGSTDYVSQLQLLVDSLVQALSSRPSGS